MTVYVVESGKRDWATILEAVFLTAEEAEQYRSELRTVEGGPDERSNYHPVRAVPVGRPNGLRLATEYTASIHLWTGAIDQGCPRQVMAGDEPESDDYTGPNWPAQYPPDLHTRQRILIGRSTVSLDEVVGRLIQKRAEWMKYHGYA